VVVEFGDKLKRVPADCYQLHQQQSPPMAVDASGHARTIGRGPRVLRRW
jgi:hypothetical protein